MQIKIQNAEIVLSAPSSYSARWDVYSAAASNPNRSFAAALGLCWRGPTAPKARLAQHKFDALSYGGAVMDELVARGVPVADIMNAGVQAWHLCGEGLITATEVEDAENFSDGGDTSTAGSSPSAENTDRARSGSAA